MARYYTRFEPDPALVTLYADLQGAALSFFRAARREVDPVLRAALQTRGFGASEIERALRARLERHAVRSAAQADELIRQRIEATRKRPRRSPPGMSSHILSRPLATSEPSGAIGVADLDELDKSNPAARMGRTGVPYWMAQEYGSSAAVGRRVPGYFQPGNARPDPAQFRVHPYFEQSSKPAPRGTPAMVIKRPIEARWFLKDGSADALAFHTRGLKEIDRQALRGIAAI
jgi:hypothetical protein